MSDDSGKLAAQLAASAEILRVIGTFPADVQPVFDAIVAAAARLFPLCNAGVTMLQDGALHLKAFAGPRAAEIDRAEVAAFYPLLYDPARVLSARVIEEARTLELPDSGAPGVPEIFARAAQVGKFRSAVFVPLVREGRGLGVLVLTHPEPGFRLSAGEIALLETFAGQAVIAIENARLFNELEEQTRLVAAASRNKSEFLANMSHELRTPLNTVIGFAEVLRDRMVGEVNAKQAEYLEDIREAGEHLLSLVNDVLDLSKIEAGQMELKPEAFALAGAIEEAVGLMRERAVRYRVKLACEAAPGVGEIRADRRKLKQILLNLLSNALKFTPEGGRVDVTARKSGEGFEIAVRDSGVGISPEDQASLFKEFKQFGSDARKAEGTGLGLALTRRMVELHGGAIEVKSEPGKGSTFTVSLPAP